MEVMVGWSSEFGRQKFDVTVQESDVRRLLVEFGIPVELADQLTTVEVFRLQDLEARRFAAFAAVEYKTATQEEVTPQLLAAKQNREKLIHSIKVRFNLVPPG